MFLDRIKVVLVAAMSLAALSCQNEGEVAVAKEDMRTLEVFAAQTRTTIGYEASDVSHLEWCAGDVVAYVTDVEGDEFRLADMKESHSGWYFLAEVAGEAQSVYVIYPAGDNEGKTLAEVKASLVADIVQVAGESFDGSLLPMMGEATIGTHNRVDAVYYALASVIRFHVQGEGHDVESLRSVTLTTNEPLVGEYSLDATSGEVVFDGSANSIKVSYESASSVGEDLLLANGHDIYMVVPSAAFTGVDVVVETDLDTYTWNGGAMDLSHPERRLYRIALDLNASSEAPAPVNRYFAPVCDMSEITADGTYLLAVKLGGKYYVTNNYPTDAANYYYVEGIELPSDEFGVIYNNDAMAYTWNIKSEANGYMFYSPNMEKQGTMGVYLISQGGSGMFSGEDGYEGKAWYVTEDKLPSGDSTMRAYWDIALDGAGIAKLYNKYDRGENMNVCYKYCTSHNYFTLCFEGAADKADIAILKLAE